VFGVRILLAILTYVLAVLVYNNIYTVKEIDLIDEEELVDNSESAEVAEKTEILERIAIKNGQKIDVVMISEVIYLQAEGDYVMIHSPNSAFLSVSGLAYPLISISLL
jgi:DNA-binding LytR/AlgR family response regulator